MSAGPSFPIIHRDALKAVQVNLGYRCNQACTHCHVEAGPKRTEEMSLKVMADVEDFIRAVGPQSVDITGGAPELHPSFRPFVTRLRALGVEVIDRCNLTIIEEPGFEDLPQFLAANGVTIVASLPCHSLENVDAQRGKGVFAKSLRGLKALNDLGYGDARRLDLVYNPMGPHLPPHQQTLEKDYREQLAAHGLRFSNLLTLTNMPIKRFRASLMREGRLESYMQLLYGAFDTRNLEHLMCRSLLSIDWQGYVYDCDFNQMLGLASTGTRTYIGDIDRAELAGHEIKVGQHCFGCAAGQGSSCGGALNA
ncbi:MAG: arsenosugar biosynthesis radical SAM (seleno)protein ArsS [Pseudomonadota bacterium]